MKSSVPSIAAYPTSWDRDFDDLKIETLSSRLAGWWEAWSCLQVRLHIASCGLDKGNGGRLVQARHDFVTHIVGEDVVVLGEGVYGLNILIEEVGRPCRSSARNGTGEGKGQVNTVGRY